MFLVTGEIIRDVKVVCVCVRARRGSGGWGCWLGKKFCTVDQSQAKMWVSTMDRDRAGSLGVAAWTVGKEGGKPN